MQIEIREDLSALLQHKAAASGMSVSSYANLVMQTQLVEDPQHCDERQKAIALFEEHMKTAASNSGREGLGWREFIHEGHSR